MPEWSLDPAKFGKDIEIAMRLADLRPVDVAGRLYGEGKKEKRSGQTRMSEWVAGKGIDVKQLSLLFGLMRENPRARDYLLSEYGVPVPEAPLEVADPELAEWLVEARYAWEHQGHDVIRTQLGAFRAFLRHISGGLLRKPANGDGGE